MALLCDQTDSIARGRTPTARLQALTHITIALTRRVVKRVRWQGVENRVKKSTLASDWSRVRRRSPHAPVMLLKMLFVSYRYNVSERDVESLTNLHLVVKWFVGLGVDE